MHDLVIRNARVIDGTGSAEFVGDMAVTDGVITDVGEVTGNSSRQIDADGQLLMPGWVDIHTHYDGQATWDPEMTPSSWHGVTTAVFGKALKSFLLSSNSIFAESFNQFLMPSMFYE